MAVAQHCASASRLDKSYRVVRFLSYDAGGAARRTFSIGKRVILCSGAPRAVLGLRDGRHSFLMDFSLNRLR